MVVDDSVAENVCRVWHGGFGDRVSETRERRRSIFGWGLERNNKCHQKMFSWNYWLSWSWVPVENIDAVVKSVDEASHSPSPFSQYIDADMVDKYSKIWAGLVVLYLWSVAEPDKYRVPLTVEHTAILAEMEPRWRQGDIGDDSFDFPPEGVWPEETLEDIVLRFSKSIVMYEDWETVGVMPYYCGVLGYNLKSSIWYMPDQYTPTLSAIQYCMRVTLFESCLRTNKLGKFTNDSVQTLSLDSTAWTSGPNGS